MIIISYETLSNKDIKYRGENAVENFWSKIKSFILSNKLKLFFLKYFKLLTI